MKTKTLTIGLFPDRLDVIVCAGARAVASRRIPLSFEQDSMKWCQHVRDAAKALRAAATELGAIGLSARVLYSGPTACSEYASPRANSASEAASAAILASAESLSCPLDMASTRAMVVTFEKHETDSKGHVVVAADTDEALSALNDMITLAGLKFQSATPIDSIMMSTTAVAALESNTQPFAALHFGEQRSFLVVVADKKIVFARPIAVGLDSLVASLKRPIRLAGGQTVELNDDAARRIVHECGFPSRAQIVHEELQLTGGNIVPVLQPVLQRFMVELRQSLRFALPENQRSDVTIRLMGPGARTPGFTQIVSDEIGANVDVEERFNEFNYLDPQSATSELIEALSAKRPFSELGLEPLTISRKRRMRHMQRWLWTGAAASLAMIGFDAMRVGGRLTDVRKQTDALQTQAEGNAALKATSDKLLAASAAMTSLQNTIRAEVGSRVCMGAVMQELSRLTPPSIRLFSVTFKPGTGVTVGGVSGYAIGDANNPEVASHLLEAYMQRLGESPLLQRLALANVQTTVVENMPAQSFDVSFNAVAAPVDQLPAVAALAGVTTDQE